VTTVTAAIILLPLCCFRKFFERKTTAGLRRVLWFVLILRLLIPLHLPLPNPPAQITLNDPGIFAYSVYSVRSLSQSVLYRRDEAKIVPVTLVSFAGSVWIAGVAAFTIYQFYCYSMMRRRLLRWSTPVTREEIWRIAYRAARDVGLRHSPYIVICRTAGTPLVTGLIQPIVILPDEDYNDSELYDILLHEMTHAKRGDVWYKMLLVAAKTVYWFNPLVYWMTREAVQDVELSCDDRVLHGRDRSGRSAYGTTIVNSLARHRFGDQMVAKLSSGAQGIHRRISNIMNPKAGHFAASAVGLSLACVLLFGGFLSCQAQALPFLTHDHLYLGSFTDQIQVENGRAVVQGLHRGMSITRVLRQYDMSDKDAAQYMTDNYTLRDLAYFDETTDFVWTLGFAFDENGGLSEVSYSARRGAFIRLNQLYAEMDEDLDAAANITVTESKNLAVASLIVEL
jgi:beta-lactamase regulating signal transducer with metallopeptidase domain